MNTEASIDENISDSTILIVDDSANNVKYLNSLLTAKGFKTKIASNGLQALEIIGIRSPDLILLDIMMPVMNGFETCRKIKESRKTNEIPVIFLSARNNTSDIIKGFELGASDYVSKPFSNNELIAKIEVHLRLKNSQETVVKQRNELKEIIQILCHDLSNPLGAVISCFELAEHDPCYLHDNRHLILEYLRRQYDIIGLVRELRTIAENKAVLKLTSVNLLWAVNESIKTLKYQMDRKNIKVEVFIDKGSAVLAEKVSLVNSVLNNLLTNAIKFSYPESTITISSEKKEEKHHLSISDSGIGIPLNMMEKVFSADKRSTRPGTKGERGTGFGIPLVKKFISEYGGTIEIESKDETAHQSDHGTTITLILNEALNP